MSERHTFWRLTRPESVRGLAEWDDSVDCEQVTCPITSRHMRGGPRIGPLRVVLPSSRVGDFVWTWYSECLVQDHVLVRLREAGLTGFEAVPAEVTRIRSTRSRGKGARAGEAAVGPLWELTVTGCAGEAPPESGIRMRFFCEGCKLLRYTTCIAPDKLIDPEQWDGSDFFIVWPLPAFIFVSERAASLIREERYTGCRLVPPEKLTFVGDGFGPGCPPPGREVKGPEAFPGVEVCRFQTTDHTSG